MKKVLIYQIQKTFIKNQKKNQIQRKEDLKTVFVKTQFSVKNAKDILKNRIQCKPEMMFARVSKKKKLIDGRMVKFDWVNNKLFLQNIREQLKYRDYSYVYKHFFNLLKQDIGIMVNYGYYTPDDLSELMEIVLNAQISESQPLRYGNINDMIRDDRNKTRQNMCNFLLCCGLNVNRVSAIDGQTLLFKALQTFIIRNGDESKPDITATAVRLLNRSRLACDSIYTKIVEDTQRPMINSALRPVNISTISEDNLELTQQNIHESSFSAQKKAILLERFNVFCKKHLKLFIASEQNNNTPTFIAKSKPKIKKSSKYFKQGLVMNNVLNNQRTPSNNQRRSPSNNSSYRSATAASQDESNSTSYIHNQMSPRLLQKQKIMANSHVRASQERWPVNSSKLTYAQKVMYGLPKLKSSVKGRKKRNSSKNNSSSVKSNKQKPKKRKTLKKKNIKKKTLKKK